MGQINLNYTYELYKEDKETFRILQRLSNENKIDSAKNTLEKLHKVPVNSIPYYVWKAELNLKLEDKELGYKTLKMAVENGYSPEFANRNFQDLSSDFIDTLKLIHEEYLKKLDNSLIAKIKLLFYKDQSIRNYFNTNLNSLSQFQKDSIRKEMAFIDSSNIEAFKILIKINGWPNMIKIGNSTINKEFNVNLLLIHANEYDCFKLLPYMLDECYHGRENWIYFNPIMTNSIIRYNKINGFIPLRHAYGSNADLSELQCESVLKYLVRYPKKTIKIILSCSENKKYGQLLFEYLINENIQESRIEIIDDCFEYNMNEELPKPKIFIKII